MALRLVQVALPRDRRNVVEEVMRESEPLGHWSSALHDDSVLISALVESHASEILLDKIQHRLEHGERNYRIIVLPVEGTVPILEEETDSAAPQPTDGGRDRLSRTELLHDLADGLKLSPRYFVSVLLSSVVAAVGLLRNDVAIVIGAMVIAPLLTPNVALALATTLGDLDMARRALRTNAYGITAALGFAVAVGAVMELDPSSPAVASRSVVSLADVALALAAGSAGALAFTTGIPAALVGVMVAVALLPPTVVTGLHAGSRNWELAYGSGLLLFVNVIGVNLSGVLTFWSQGLRPRTWWEADKARRARKFAVVIWSVLLVVLIGLIYLGQQTTQ